MAFSLIQLGSYVLKWPGIWCATTTTTNPPSSWAQSTNFMAGVLPIPHCSTPSLPFATHFTPCPGRLLSLHWLMKERSRLPAGVQLPVLMQSTFEAASTYAAGTSFPLVWTYMCQPFLKHFCSCPAGDSCFLKPVQSIYFFQNKCYRNRVAIHTTPWSHETWEGHPPCKEMFCPRILRFFDLMESYRMLCCHAWRGEGGSGVLSYNVNWVYSYLAGCCWQPSAMSLCHKHFL